MVTTVILVATLFVLEGVDLQACFFVTIFDVLTVIKNVLTMVKSYIQMKVCACQRNDKIYVSQQYYWGLNLQIAKVLEEQVLKFVAFH